MGDGDDYWTDPLKLQKQVDFMEKNKGCSLCFHPTKIIYNNRSVNKIVHRYNNLEDTVFKGRDMIAGKINGWTASLLLHSDIVQNLPQWFTSVRYGDAALKLFCAANGDIGYIGGNAMSVYRRGYADAWSGNEGTSRVWEEKRLEHHIKLIQHFNDYTDHKFEKSLTLKKSKHVLNYLLAVQNYCSKLEAAKIIGKNVDMLFLKPKKFFWVCLRFAFGQKVYEFLRRLRRTLRKQ